MNLYGSSPLVAIGQQLLSGIGGNGSYPFSQQIFNAIANILKQQGGEYLKGILEQVTSSGQASPGRKSDLNRVNAQFRPVGGITQAPVQTAELLPMNETVQKYTHLLDRVMANQSNLQKQLGQYRNRLAQLQSASHQIDEQAYRPRRFFFRTTHPNGRDPVNILKEVDIWLNTSWQETEQEFRTLLAESRELTGNLKQ